MNWFHDCPKDQPCPICSKLTPEELAYEVAKFEYFFWNGPKPLGLKSPIDYWLEKAKADEPVIVEGS